MSDTEETYDVVMYELEKQTVEKFAGENMRLENGFYNARRRLETCRTNLNGDWEACIVPHGEYKLGDFISNEFVMSPL